MLYNELTLFRCIYTKLLCEVAMALGINTLDGFLQSAAVIAQQLEQDAITKSLHELSLIAVPINPTTLPALLKCIEANPINTLRLSAILILPESLNKLLETLASHPSLERVYFTDCNIRAESVSHLAQLISKSKTLSYVELNNQQIILNAELQSAIKESQSLCEIKGLDGLPIDALSHLAENKKFKQLSSLLKEWRENSAENTLQLDLRKSIFYKIVKDIQQSQHNKPRLNQMLVQFYLYLGDAFKAFDDNELATTYLNRVLECQDLDANQKYIAHQTLGEISYNAATLSESTITPEKKIESHNSKTESNISQDLFVAYQHFRKATSCATSLESQSQSERLAVYCGTHLGEKLLTECDTPTLQGFKRLYTRTSPT